MKREDQILIDLLADFVNGQSPGALPEVSLDALYQTACKHNVTGIVAELLHPFLENAEEPAVRKLQESHMATVFRSVLLEEEVKLFSARMEEEKIPYAFFKGYELRELYPVPELRTMGDVDVLVRDEDLERTAEVLCGLGYQKEEGGGAVWAFKKDNFTYEVHRRLAFGSYWNDVDYEGYFAAAFDRLTTGEGSRRYFTPEDHFIFLCFHLAKHLNSTGAGIRMVMDLALFLKVYQDTLDWDYIRAQLELLQMDRFVKTVLYASGEWFGIPANIDPTGVQADPDTLDQLKYYIMTGGIFGFERDDSIRRLRSGISGRTERASFLIRLKALWRIAFPKKKHMVYFIPALERYPVLLPAAWINRWRLGLQNRWKMKAAFKGIDQSESLEEAKMQYRLLKKIGL